MAVAIDAVGTPGGTPNATLVTSLNYTGITVGTGADRGLIFECGINNATFGQNPTGVTATWDNGGSNQAMTLLATRDDPGGNGDTIFVFGLRNPVSGNKTLRIAWTRGCTIWGNAIAFTGVDQTSDAAAFQTVTGSGTDASPSSLSIASTTDSYCAVIFESTNQWSSAGAGGTEYFDSANDGGHLESDNVYGVRGAGASPTKSLSANFTFNFGLTWAGIIVNVSPSTAGAAPFAQDDWPVPRGPGRSVVNLGYVDGSETWLFAGAAPTPFFGTTQPNPTLRVRNVANLGYVDPTEFWLDKPIGAQVLAVPRGPVRTIAHDGYVDGYNPFYLLTGAKPFTLLDQPNPVLRTREVANLGYVDGSEHWLFAVISPKPFAQTSWPVPPGPAIRLNAGFVDGSEFWMLKDTFFGAAGQPPQPFDWPTPRAPARINGGFVDAYPNRVVTVAAAPFSQTDWPIPRAAKAPHVGFVSAYAMQFLQPFAQEDWPNPRGRSPLNTGFGSAGLALGVPYSLDPPFALDDWPVPKGSAPLNTGFVASGLALVVAPTPPAPFAQEDWPTPRSRAGTDRGFIAATPLALSTPVKPAPTPAWDLPQFARRSPPGFVQDAAAARMTFLSTKPFAQNDWPLPVRLRVITAASSMRPSVNTTITIPTSGYVPRSDGAALLI